MMAPIDEQTIAQLDMAAAETMLKGLNDCINLLEDTEPPSHHKDDHYYWYREFSDIWYDKKLVEKRISALLDQELDNYFKLDPMFCWSKEKACNILKLKLDREELIL
jgi:hypothetical protein